MKNKIDLLINSDFTTSQFISNLNKSFKKKINLKINANNQDNLNICMIDANSHINKTIIFLSQIEKTFLNFKKFEAEGKVNQKKFEHEISTFAKKIELISKKNQKIIFFLWPMDTKDFFFGNYNFIKNGKNWLINFTNVFLTSKISNLDNIVIVDPNYNLLKNNNKIEIFNHKTKYLTNNNYHFEYISFLADHTSKILTDIINFKKIKLIILDLDNTLWGGEAGELKAENLELGPNSIKGNIFNDFQNRLKFLKNSGVLLAICSKNDLNNIEKVFLNNNYMSLSLKDFSSIKVNWDQKNKNVKKILDELNLRAENSLFIDDSKYERNIVKSDIKDINIFPFPDNILDLNDTFNNFSLLSINKITKTDKLRTLYYKQERSRALERKKYFNDKKWIKSLKIKLKIQNLKNFERAEEMFLRTNQFNTSHQRLTKSNILNFIKTKNNKIYQVSMYDKFGDYGIIGIISVTNLKKKFIIKHFLLSCRVFERGVESSILDFLKKNKNYKNKKGIILIKRNEKNSYVQNLLDKSNNIKKLNSKEYLIQ
jgi:FkbH-like protein